MPKRSQEHLAARREQILDGAQRCFAEYGYAGATVARLEEEIGLSRGAIFNYFDGKQALFVAVAARVTVLFQQIVAEEGLDAAVRAMAAENPAWLGALIETQSKLRHDSDFVRRLEAAYEKVPRLGPWFEERQHDGTFRADLSATQLGQFAAMVLNGLALRVASEEETDVESLLVLLHDALAPRK